jgi:Zn-dependent protease with chaperone function
MGRMREFRHQFSRPAATIKKKVRVAPPSRSRLLFNCLIAPLLVLVFFVAAPHWLNVKIRAQMRLELTSSARFSSEQKAQGLRFLDGTDFEKVCLEPPAPTYEKLRTVLDRAGVTARFQRLRWSLWLSLTLVAVLGAAIAAILALNQKAKSSPGALIASYQLSWKIAMLAALMKLLLLIPLLTYGSFEFTVLSAGHYIPKLLIAIVLGGVVALWGSAQALLRKVPMEFKEPMSREVTPEEAPELWAAVRHAAERLHTAPPDHIIIGMQLNFYVTEMPVQHVRGRVEGRTLFLSHPLLKQFTEEETLSIIGHELGHFIGEDTRLTRDFYPLRFKIHAMMVALARSGWVAWTSFQFLNFFSWSFAETEGVASRQRELLADQKGASLVSPQTTARALVKFHALVEGFKHGIQAAIHDPAQNPVELPLRSIIREKLIPDAEFWTQLFEQKSPHPLDSHPALRVRLESLGQPITVEQAQSIATAEGESAYDRWLAMRGDLFQELIQQTEEAVNKMRSKAKIAEASYQTDAGKKLLDQHFPEQKWRACGSGFWFVLALLVLLTLGAAAAALLVPVAGVRIMAGCFTLLLGVAGTGLWTRHHQAQLALNAGGLTHTGWHRSLPFQDVQAISARRAYSTITVTLRLKQSQPGIWKFSVPGLKRKAVSISLSGLDAKPMTIAQTIFRYYTRQAE